MERAREMLDAGQPKRAALYLDAAADKGGSMTVHDTLAGQTLYRDAYRMLGIRSQATLVELGRRIQGHTFHTPTRARAREVARC